MPQEFSFDVVSRVDMQAVEDAVNTVHKEVATRFDFKGSRARIELDKKERKMHLFAEDNTKLHSLRDILQTRLVKRGVPLKNLEYQSEQDGESGTRKQQVTILYGISSDKARQIAAAIKSYGRKVTHSIQGDQLRVVSKSKDELQAVIVLLKSVDFGQELQFANYR